VKKENSGLYRTTLELAEAEERQGHNVTLIQPTEENPLYGNGRNPDIELVHSQMSVNSYYNDKPKFMWMHGEPLSSVGNKVSMKAIVDLASKMDAFMCMRKEERIIWNSIKRTYYVPKGIDLERYKPIDGIVERLPGEPAVLYVENWRGQRNPLYLAVAMQEVYKKYPKARLHLVNCPDLKMNDMFKALIANNKWWPFIRTLSGGVDPGKVNELYNKVDIVVSCLYPLYARSIEAFGAGKAFIGPGYNEPDYPWTCDLQPESIADAIIKCWEGYDSVDYRQWAIDNHDVNETVKQSVEIYERYL
jgi:glycosyltransferase involved in cell wall biosynthesis